MNRRLTFLIILFLLIHANGLMSCQSAPPVVSPATQTQEQPALLGEPPPPRSLPQQMSWLPGEQLFSTQGEASVGVYLTVLDNNRSVVIYSLAAPRPFSDNLKEIVSENNRADLSNKESQLLAQLGDVRFIASTFDPPKVKGDELHLHLESSKFGNGLDVQLTKEFKSIESGHPLTASDRESVAGIDVVEQGGYRITFNGFFLYTGDLQADQKNSEPRTQQEDILAASETKDGQTEGPIPTPEPRQLPRTLLELSDGKPVRNELTLRIENLATNEVNFLYIVILENGQVKTKLMK
jgi:hypothetical protein